MPRLADPRRRLAAGRQRAVVLGDLMLDVVLAPERDLVSGTDVSGHVHLRQGGSAATTARWLSRLGIRTRLVCAIGRDAVGRSLVQHLAADHVDVGAVRVAGGRTGRIGVVVAPGGERSFVADRGAADRLRPEDLRPAWFERVDVLHLPAYSLLTMPLGDAGLAAIRHARRAGAIVSIDLASVGPLLAAGRPAARQLVREAAPDVVFATEVEAGAVIGDRGAEALLELAPVAALKQGRKGATVLARDPVGTLRFEVATRVLPVTDTTGAGDAFDAGFLASWILDRRRGAAQAAALQRAALAGNRAASRHLASPPPELTLG